MGKLLKRKGIDCFSNAWMILWQHKKIWVNRAKSFEEAQDFDIAHYLSLSSTERVEKVRYCVIGAFASAFHARPRYTKDKDLEFADIC